MRLKEKAKTRLKRFGLFGIARRLYHLSGFLTDFIYYALESLTRPIYHRSRQFLSRLIFVIRKKRRAGYDNSEKLAKNIISVLCPTRERPRNVRRLVSSIYRTSVFPKRIEILFYIDSDDRRKNEYLSFFNKAKNDFGQLLGCEAVVGVPLSVSKSWDIIAKKSRGNLLMLANDDMVFADYGWDERLDEEAGKYPDRIFCMWFNDGGFQKYLAVFPIVSRKWVETVGYFTPGIFEFSFNDTWIFDIGRRINRLHYIGDILVEHVHYLYNRYRKARMDNTYKRQADGKQGRDKALFEKTSAEREIAAKKLTAVINSKTYDE